ncbi:aminomethyltransferase, mitochondrial [Sitophilus oryzae]|uniref:Aminomethyltransferase n=1 Tax=Sitophilus oryzae TaxID=7048 RepID=A0A6J2X804_SITOR|nr:aminomethyltransferase, mitochondrial [Sitophilus oryzae]
MAMYSTKFLLIQCAKNNLQRCFSSQKGQVTSLYEFHIKNGGKMVNFGGYQLPVQYSDQSIVNSHIFTRKNASIFDVSHMLQTEIKGKHSIEYFETLCTADIKGLEENSSVLTVFTNENGGILDDLIVTKINEEFLYVVSNAAMKQQDQEIMSRGLNSFQKRVNSASDIRIQFFHTLERTLIALQGPKASTALQSITDLDLSKLYFMKTAVGSVANVQNCRISRCGYTGEDGFEISIPAERSENVVQTLLENSDVKLAGLGARDSLRLEAGLCLYGSDINGETTPVDAALTWLVAKKRRETKDFPGADKIVQQIKEGSKIKRVGITSSTGPPPRHGTIILSEDGQEIGEITSGCPSPTLEINVAMGYVPAKSSKVGTKVGLKIRGKQYNGIITKMPFVKSNYYNKVN